jgi:Protein of unknown function (DUF3012)
MKKLLIVLSSLTLVSLLAACSPEVGTKAWCGSMGDKAKGDWTAVEAKDFAKYCVLKNYKDE